MSLPSTEPPPLPARAPLVPSAAVSAAILQRCGSELQPCRGASTGFRLVSSILVSGGVVLALLGVGWLGHLSAHSRLRVAVTALSWGMVQGLVLVVGFLRPPGRRLARFWRWSLIAAVCPLVLLQPFFVSEGEGVWRGSGASGLAAARCASVSLLCGLGLVGAMFYIWRRTDPLSPMLSGALLGMSGGLAGAVANTFRCPDHGLVHLLLGHASVVVVATGIGAIAGRRWLVP